MGDDAKRESEPRVFVGQQLGKASVEGGEGGDDTNSPTRLVNSFVSGELGGHEEEEGQVEEEEKGNKCNIDPQGRQAEVGRRDQMRF